VGQATHLTRRFFGALRPGGPSPADEDWVATALSPSVHTLWRRMPGADRRHAVGVARQVSADLVPAALMHDVGKIESGFGTLARVPATLIGMAGGRRRAAGWSARQRGLRRRVGLYLRHAPLGADMLQRAGADQLVVAWAGEHHLPSSSWTVPAAAGAALKAADDD
jgi:hypothetical protein